MSENHAANQQASKMNRADRFPSHALVDVRKYKYLPFGVRSGVLLDVSLSGFKLEFTGEVKTQPGEKYWLSVPLAPLGIYAPSRLLTQGEVRWYDEKRYRIGGVFIGLSATDRLLIDQVIDTLRKRGFLL